MLKFQEEDKLKRQRNPRSAVKSIKIRQHFYTFHFKLKYEKKFPQNLNSIPKFSQETNSIKKKQEQKAFPYFLRKSEGPKWRRPKSSEDEVLSVSEAKT